MRELQQVTATVPDAAKRCRFYRVELLNGGKYRTRGEVPPDRRKRGENNMRRGGGKVRLKRVGNREREEKKGKCRRKKRKARKALITSEKKEKEKRKHEKK